MIICGTTLGKNDGITSEFINQPLALGNNQNRKVKLLDDLLGWRIKI